MLRVDTHSFRRSFFVIRLSVAALLFCSIGVTAQKLDFPTLQSELLSQNIEMDEPTEGRAKFFAPLKESTLKHDLRVHLPKGEMEIWVAFSSYDSLNLATQIPEIRSKGLAVTAATHEEASVTTVLKLGSAFAKKTFNAEWGKEYYFRPKREVSDRGHCRMLSLYREGIGQLTVFFFFDEKNESLESFYELFRFVE